MATTSKTKDASAFDVSKYTISTSSYTQTVTIEETGDTFEVELQPLSWAKKNQLLGKYMSWDSDGSTNFNAAEYIRACLTEMIIDAPWGKTTESFLISIDHRLGQALEKIVPEAFGIGASQDVDTIKKEL